MLDLDDLTDLGKLALDIGEDLFLDWLLDSNKKGKQERPPKVTKESSTPISSDPWEQKHPTPPWEKE